MKRLLIVGAVAALVAASASLSLASAAPLAQVTAPPPRKLSGTMPAFGSVIGTPRLSPDGRYVVYRADQETDGVYDLWSVQVDGARPPVKLNGPLPAGEFVREDFAITSRGRVIYAAEQDVAGRVDLYSVPVTGGSPVRLSDPAVIGGESGSFLTTPNGGTIVFTAVGLTGRTQIYAVPADGGSVTTLLAPPVLGGFPSRLTLTADGSRLVFYGDIEVNSRDELFSVPITGGAYTKLNGPLAAGGFVLGFDLSPDGLRVAYVAGQDTADQWEVYSVRVGGGTPLKLNATFPAYTDAGDTLWISPDSAYVLYTADVNLDEAFELYRVRIGGGGEIKLNGALVAEGDVDGYSEPLFSADSRTVVYRADQQTNDLYELYAVPIGGGASAKLNDPVSGFGVSFPMLSPDRRHIVFGAQPGGASNTHLYSKPMGPGPVVDLFPTVAVDDHVNDCVAFTPDGRWIAFAVYDSATDGLTPYVERTGGGPALSIGGPFVVGGGVAQCTFGFYPDATGLIYVADQDTEDVFELYTVSLADVVATPPAPSYALYVPVIHQGVPEVHIVQRAVP